MLYVKAHLSDQVEIKVDLYEDEIFTSCGDCGMEITVTEEDLVQTLQSDELDFQGTTWFCPSCTKKRREKR